MAPGGRLEGRPAHAMPAPDSQAARRSAIEHLGLRAWLAMREGQPGRLLADEFDLRTLLLPAASTRVSALRPDLAHRIGSTRDFVTLLADAEFAGVCLQGARDEPAAEAAGLRQAGWVFDRVLVIGRRSTGRRIAAWLEGGFVYTDVGFVALDFERVERPRWEHADLELAPCDLSIRLDRPLAAR